MAPARFAFSNEWELEAPVHEVVRLLTDIGRFPRWMREVTPVAHAQGVTPDGWTVGEMAIRSWLPVLLWLRVRARHEPSERRIVVHAAGHLAGRGEWTYEVEGPLVRLRFICDIELKHPLLTPAAPYARRLFERWHATVMRRAEAAMKRELTRRMVEGGGRSLRAREAGLSP